MPKNPNRISLSITPEYRAKLLMLGRRLTKQGIIPAETNGGVNLSAVLRYLIDLAK